MEIHDHAQAFLDETKILYQFQSGFRKHYSTYTSCLSYLNDGTFRFSNDKIIWLSNISNRVFKVNLNKSHSLQKEFPLLAKGIPTPSKN